VSRCARAQTTNGNLMVMAKKRGLRRAQVAQQENATAVVEALQLGVFGPLLAQPAAAAAASHGDGAEEKEHDPEEDAEGEIETVHDIENTRKRQIERAPQQALVNGGSPAKRPRLSNGYENGVDAATDPMELDGQHGSDNHAYPSPLEGEQAPTPVPRTDGPEQGTQIEKVQELAPETVFIPLGADEAPVSSPLARMSSENAPVLLHCQWNPQDPTKLAAGGTDALARIWTISRAATATTADPASHVSVPPFHSLTDEDTEPKATVTAMAWNRDGTAIAIASESADNRGRINLWSADGSHIQRMEVPEAPVIKLRWSPNNDAILAISPENEDALVTVYASAGANSMSYVVKGHSPDIDATWLSEQDILLCGGQLLMSLRCEGGEITDTKKFDTRPDDSMSQVHFDWRARLAATCGDKGFVDVRMPTIVLRRQ
jgi:transducin (beta)-like 1